MTIPGERWLIAKLPHQLASQFLESLGLAGGPSIVDGRGDSLYHPFGRHDHRHMIHRGFPGRASLGPPGAVGGVERPVEERPRPGQRTPRARIEREILRVSPYSGRNTAVASVWVTRRMVRLVRCAVMRAMTS